MFQKKTPPTRAQTNHRSHTQRLPKHKTAHPQCPSHPTPPSSYSPGRRRPAPHNVATAGVLSPTRSVESAAQARGILSPLSSLILLFSHLFSSPLFLLSSRLLFLLSPLIYSFFSAIYNPSSPLSPLFSPLSSPFFLLSLLCSLLSPLNPYL